MAANEGSYPDPLYLIGEEWIEHGYRVSPIFDQFEPCIVCGAPNSTCTEHDAYPPPEPEVIP